MSWRGGRAGQVCYLSEERCDWTGRRQNWLTVAAAGPVPRVWFTCNWPL